MIESNSNTILLEVLEVNICERRVKPAAIRKDRVSDTQ